MKTNANIYLYAIVDANKLDEKVLSLSGVQGQAVYTLVRHDIGAYVSNISEKTIRPERRYLAAHHEVLKQLNSNQTILPVRFGIIAKNSMAIIKLLNNYQVTLKSQLKKFTGQVEMTISMKWDVPNIYEYFINRYSELEEARKILSSQQNKPPRDLLIETGELFEFILTNERETHIKNFKIKLLSVCDDVIESSVYREDEVFNLVCLIQRDKKILFEETLHEAAKEWDENFLIKYTGPWPLHNFVQLELEL